MLTGAAATGAPAASVRRPSSHGPSSVRPAGSWQEIASKVARMTRVDPSRRLGDLASVTDTRMTQCNKVTKRLHSRHPRRRSPHSLGQCEGPFPREIQSVARETNEVEAARDRLTGIVSQVPHDVLNPVHVVMLG